MKQWWHQEIEDAAKSLDSDLSSGLTSQEASIRFEKYGPNQLKEAKRYSALGIFFEQFEDFIAWVPIGAARPSLL